MCPSRYRRRRRRARSRAPCRGRADVAERGLEPEGEEHHAGDHRQMEVAVGVQREPVQLQACRLHEPSPRDDRSHVEVEPPERGDDDDPEGRRHDYSRIQLEAGPDADGDDRLAERDQDDQPVPLGEVLGRDPPAAAQRRSQLGRGSRSPARQPTRRCADPPRGSRPPPTTTGRGWRSARTGGARLGGPDRRD